MNTIDFKAIKRKKRHELLPQAYLEAEQLMMEIKSEYFCMLKGISKDDVVYEKLWRRFETFEYDLTTYLFYEFKDRLIMSLLALDCVFEKDNAIKKEAREDFQIEFEVMTLLQMEHGLENIKFREDYEKAVREEWADE